jgi:hypothetical protein
MASAKCTSALSICYTLAFWAYKVAKELLLKVEMSNLCPKELRSSSSALNASALERGILYTNNNCRLFSIEIQFELGRDMEGRLAQD